MLSGQTQRRVNTQLNRTQGAVLAFFGVAWLTIVILLTTQRDVYDEALHLEKGDLQQELALLLVVSVLIGVLSLGVTRRWRWTFWLVMIAFLAGALRLPVSALEFAGAMSTDVPRWYLMYQAALGIAQLIVGLLMLAGYRKAGLWGRY